MRHPLNLASEPFRNERLPALALALATGLLLIVTLVHAVAIWRLLPGRTSARHQEVAALEAELLLLRKQAQEARPAKPEPAVLAQWALVRDLVDKRTFSWTELCSRLEEVLPPGVRLVAIAPTAKGGEISLELDAVARTAEEGIGFVRVLQERSEFDDVYPRSSDRREQGIGFRYAMRYKPQPRPKGAPSPARGPSPEDEP